MTETRHSAMQILREGAVDAHGANRKNAALMDRGGMLPSARRGQSDVASKEWSKQMSIWTWLGWIITFGWVGFVFFSNFTFPTT